MQKFKMQFLFSIIFLSSLLVQELKGQENYPYWGNYSKTPVSEIKKAFLLHIQ